MFRLGIDSTIKMRIDGEIIKLPAMPLSDEDKEFLIQSKKDMFVEMYKRFLIKYKLLEGTEKNELKTNDAFIAPAFIFMKRCLNVFDKSKYKSTTFTSQPEFTGPVLDKAELSFLKDQIDFVKISYPDFELSYLDDLSEDELVEFRNKLAVIRLEFYWEVHARIQIEYLMNETVKTQVDKGIPKKATVKGSKKYVNNYIEALRDKKDQFNDAELDISEADQSIDNTDDFSDEVAELDFTFRKYLFCVNHLEMNSAELKDEFGKDALIELRKQELILKGRKVA